MRYKMVSFVVRGSPDTTDEQEMLEEKMREAYESLSNCAVPLDSSYDDDQAGRCAVMAEYDGGDEDLIEAVKILKANKDIETFDVGDEFITGDLLPQRLIDKAAEIGVETVSVNPADNANTFYHVDALNWKKL